MRKAGGRRAKRDSLPIATAAHEMLDVVAGLLPVPEIHSNVTIRMPGRLVVHEDVPGLERFRADDAKALVVLQLIARLPRRCTIEVDADLP